MPSQLQHPALMRRSLKVSLQGMAESFRLGLAVSDFGHEQALRLLFVCLCSFWPSSYGRSLFGQVYRRLIAGLSYPSLFAVSDCHEGVWPAGRCAAEPGAEAALSRKSTCPLQILLACSVQDSSRQNLYAAFIVLKL